MKKIVVISMSLRFGSNIDMLADNFIEGAISAGYEVEKISLAGKDIRLCRAAWLATSWADASSMMT